jgi:GTP-binding protein
MRHWSRSALSARPHAIFSTSSLLAHLRSITERPDVRNIAVIAHVDHGKTTLVDSMLQQSGTVANAKGRVMDSKDQERERGITILAKNTAILLGEAAKDGSGQRRINIVDTPGHLDFSGEVERALQMVEGIILLVDAKEGVRPGTRYVLRKALSLNLKPIICMNKIDKDDTALEKTEAAIQDLFLETASDDSQLDLFFMYGSGRSGYMNETPIKEGNLTPLFNSIFNRIPPPKQEKDDAPLQMLVAQVDIDEKTGNKVAVGRVFKGSLSVGDVVTVALEGDAVDAMVTDIKLYCGMQKMDTKTASFGDICAVTLKEPIGMKVPLKIGCTLCAKGNINLWPYKRPDEPTYSLVLQESQASWKKKEAAESHGTMTVLTKRLEREVMVNTALQLEGVGTGQITMKGRGPLHLSVIIEDMRREGYEFEVQAPSVLKKTIDGVECEPFEKLQIEFKDSLVAEMVTFLSSKMAELGDITQLSDGRVSLECTMPVRLMSNVPLKIHTMTTGDGILHHSFDGYRPLAAGSLERETGALISVDAGEATDYSMSGHGSSGRFFVEPGATIYYGQIVGENSKTKLQNLGINICKRNEQLGGMRANANDKAAAKRGPFTCATAKFEDCIAWVADDELVTVTPQSIRMRKPNFNGKTSMRSMNKK